MCARTWGSSELLSPLPMQGPVSAAGEAEPLGTAAPARAGQVQLPVLDNRIQALSAVAPSRAKGRDGRVAIFSQRRISGHASCQQGEQ
mmetsp:Transcript_37093/g.98305  ORF Transcript_37093/g.98305 Transcript_37093/m.98305 type:complete len:88 (-) Transcript_37093:230-493(-)